MLIQLTELGERSSAVAQQYVAFRVVQTRVKPSAPAVNSLVPFGDHLRLQTTPVCPRSVASILHCMTVDEFSSEELEAGGSTSRQMRVDPSLLAVAIWLPPGDHAAVQTAGSFCLPVSPFRRKACAPSGAGVLTKSR